MTLIWKWDGTREIASHDYPLIGLYDSGDEWVLECQIQQMKLAGIDGVIIDWYGIDPINDYPMIHENTKLLVSIIKKAGLTVRDLLRRSVDQTGHQKPVHRTKRGCVSGTKEFELVGPKLVHRPIVLSN